MTFECWWLSHRDFIMFLLCFLPSDLFSRPSTIPLLLPPQLCSCTARFRPSAAKVWGPKTWAHKSGKSTADLKVLAPRVVTIKQVPKWGSRNIMCHRAKFSFIGNLTLGICRPLTEYLTWASGPGSTKQWWNLYDFVSCWCDKHLPARPQTSYWLYQPKLLIRHLLIGWRWRVKSSRRLRFPGCWCEWWAGRHVRRGVTARISYAALISGIKYQHGLRYIYIYIYIYITVSQSRSSMLMCWTIVMIIVLYLSLTQYLTGVKKRVYFKSEQTNVEMRCYGFYTATLLVPMFI